MADKKKPKYEVFTQRPAVGKSLSGVYKVKSRGPMKVYGKPRKKKG